MSGKLASAREEGGPSLPGRDRFPSEMTSLVSDPHCHASAAQMSNVRPLLTTVLSRSPVFASRVKVTLPL